MKNYFCVWTKKNSTTTTTTTTSTSTTSTSTTSTSTTTSPLSTTLTSTTPKTPENSGIPTYGWIIMAVIVTALVIILITIAFNYHFGCCRCGNYLPLSKTKKPITYSYGNEINFFAGNRLNTVDLTEEIELEAYRDEYDDYGFKKTKKNK